MRRVFEPTKGPNASAKHDPLFKPGGGGGGRCSLVGGRRAKPTGGRRNLAENFGRRGITRKEIEKGRKSRFISTANRNDPERESRPNSDKERVAAGWNPRFLLSDQEGQRCQKCGGLEVATKDLGKGRARGAEKKCAKAAGYSNTHKEAYQKESK